MPDSPMGDDVDATITMENLVIKGYHYFRRRPLLGFNMDVVREWDNPYDKDAFLVRMPHLANIPADKHDLVTDAKRGLTVRSIAGKDIGRLPAGLCKILAELDRDGVLTDPTCVATGPPEPSFVPWPAPSDRGGGVVVRCKVLIDVHARDRQAIVETLWEGVDRHMSDVKSVVNIV
ncbi:uncharacterized protein LOC144880005 isoform X2 [Branchiostoma floridae x Branchiostoma japonicum]